MAFVPPTGFSLPSNLAGGLMAYSTDGTVLTAPNSVPLHTFVGIVVPDQRAGSYILRNGRMTIASRATLNYYYSINADNHIVRSDMPVPGNILLGALESDGRQCKIFVKDNVMATAIDLSGVNSLIATNSAAIGDNASAISTTNDSLNTVSSRIGTAETWIAAADPDGDFSAFGLEVTVPAAQLLANYGDTGDGTPVQGSSDWTGAPVVGNLVSLNASGYPVLARSNVNNGEFIGFVANRTTDADGNYVYKINTENGHDTGLDYGLAGHIGTIYLQDDLTRPVLTSASEQFSIAAGTNTVSFEVYRKPNAANVSCFMIDQVVRVL